MSCNSNQARIAKQLIDGFRLSKNIIVTCILMYKPDGIVNKIKADYNEIEALFDLDSADNYFLNSTSLVNSLPQLDSSKQDIVAMVSAINIALATYRIFSATQLDLVSKALFTQVVPVDTDITQRIITAYSELLHKVAYGKGLVLAWESATLIQDAKAIRPDWVAAYNSKITEYEEQALNKLKSNAEPMKQDGFIMTWETAFSSMIRQSKVIRNAFLAIPKEIINASESSASDESNDDEEFFDDEFFDAVEGDLLAGRHEFDGDVYFEINKDLVNIPDNNQDNPTQLLANGTIHDTIPALKERNMVDGVESSSTDSHHQATHSLESQSVTINESPVVESLEVDSPRSQLLTKRKYSDTLGDDDDDISKTSPSTNKRIVGSKSK